MNFKKCHDCTGDVDDVRLKSGHKTLCTFCMQVRQNNGKRIMLVIDKGVKLTGGGDCDHTRPFQMLTNTFPGIFVMKCKGYKLIHEKQYFKC